MKLSRYFGTRQFCLTALTITLPIIAQNLLTTSFSLIDTLMISSLGTAELTAVGQCASWIQLLNVMLFGISSAAGVQVAQFWGGQHLNKVRNSFGVGLFLCIAVTVLFGLFTTLFPSLIMKFYTADAAVAAAGIRYLRVVAFGFVGFGLQHIANAVLRSTEQVRIPMYGTIVAVLTNIVLNYTLIFGHFGAPAMGIAGAALASCCANWIGALVTYGISFKKHAILRTTLSQLLPDHLTFVQNYFKVGLPIMINELLWGGGTAILNMIYGHIGTREYAAMTICTTIENLITTVFLSLGNSANVLVGAEIGRGKQEKAYQNAVIISCWTPVIAAFFGVLLLLFRHPIVSMFHQSTEVSRLAVQLILVIGFTLPMRFFQYIHICGILRAGADGVTAALYDFIGIWCISIPLALIGLLVQVPFLWIYLVVTLLDSLVKDILVFRRFRSKKWMIQIGT